MDKRQTQQLSIPLDLDNGEIKSYAKQHFNITFARQKKVSVYAKRIMTTVLGQIKEGDADLRPFYQMHVTDIIPEYKDKKSVHKEVKRAFDELTDLKWLIEDLEKDKFSYRHLLNTSDVNCGYDNGNITVVLNPILKPFFIEIAHFTTYEIEQYMRFGSWYSQRFWEILSAYRDTGHWNPSLREYREWMDCEKKYPNTSDLIKKTLSEPLEELKGTELEFTFKKKFADFHGKGRPPVIGLDFNLVHKKESLEDAQTKLDTMKEKHPAHKLLIERLENKWKVSLQNLVKYLPALGYDAALLLREKWELKEGSEEPIKDRVRYCNTAFVKAGNIATIGSNR